MRKASIEINGSHYQIDLDEPIDISIPLNPDGQGPNAYHAPAFQATPVIAENFIGSVVAGGPVNFLDIRLNPHGNGTHTECFGHISSQPFTINQCLNQFHFLAELISVYPSMMGNGDEVVHLDSVKKALANKEPEALVIRTLPNDLMKRKANYSGKNPPYLHFEVTRYLEQLGVKHLLIDLPSVDKEEDDGMLLAHKAFWHYPTNPRKDATITELIYIPENVTDGSYLLNLQIISLEIDASPSKPVLYKLLNP